ncbi:Hypothetical protein [Corynebacterium glutamicum ATCC 13032]|uniref:Uncharacterized protein n=1 Tax=Corynebacterium glutamicum (strain ATCC 13032 / DSM 20300 / JCM 1318 / BCRC 11384 / CCUG 27702 / LMG 3730 / NBRC 12168 / NCIMB 10025 / NRRL B-2784 / 534) TaxID=196627 RepID=Q8NMN9_CORGL|nr:Hypothetical protein [Corynebacterium glutamicum ATCC 13032]
MCSTTVSEAYSGSTATNASKATANAPEISLRTASAAHANTKEAATTAVPKISMVATGDADSSENLSTTAGIAATAHIASGIRGNIGGSLSFEELLEGLAHLVLGTWAGYTDLACQYVDNRVCRATPLQQQTSCQLAIVCVYGQEDV